jgi:hypothetical protein
MDIERETDPLDIATAMETREREACVAAQLAKPGLKATGSCLDPGCGAQLPEGQHFCGKECRDYYEKTERMKRITGKA